MVGSNAWVEEVVTVINRRFEVLGALDEPREKRELVGELDVSRSTLDRAIRELETLGLVARGDAYRLTQTGRLVRELFDGFLADVEDVVAAEEVLRQLPPEVPMSPTLLRGGTVRVAEPPSPVQALEPVDELLGACDRARGVSIAATRPESVLDSLEQRVERGASFEWVFTAEMAAFLHETFPDRIGRLSESDRFDIYRIDDAPYGLGLITVDDRKHTYVTVYDDDHTLRGAIVSDGLEAYGWAEHVYQDHLAAAEPVEPF